MYEVKQLYTGRNDLLACKEGQYFISIRKQKVKKINEKINHLLDKERTCIGEHCYLALSID